MPDIWEATLANGLRVLIQSSDVAPVVSVWIWYRVGGRNESPGRTGASHWVEHMTFKAAGRFGHREVFRLTARHGGHNNGFTGEDFTLYYETLPAEHLDLALAIEADRMANVHFEAEEAEQERGVILAERQGAENNPHYLLGEALLRTTFSTHPYGRPVIGLREDLLAMTADDLRAHYERYYRPENALLVIAGDVDAEDALRRVEAHFGELRAAPAAPEDPIPAEPPQEEERRVVLERPGGAAHVQLIYHAPPAGHPDVYPLLALDAILGGAKPVSWASGGYLGRSARLYQALVETGLATNAGSGYRVGLDPHLFGVSATVRAGSDWRQVEATLIAAVERLADQPPTEAELARAVRQAEAQFAYSRDGATSQAYALGLFATHGDWRDLEQHVKRLAAVTPADLQRVAATYLQARTRTVGVFLPNGAGPAREGSGAVVSSSPARHAATGPNPNGGGARLRPCREVLDNGIILLWHESHESPSLALRASWPAGAAREAPAQAGLASFTARLLRRGTRRHTAAQISAAVEDLGASFSLWAGTEEAALSAKCLGRDARSVLDVLREVLEEPLFAPEQVEKMCGDTLTQLREQEDSTRYQAERTLMAALYTDAHPYGRPASGTPETVGSLTREEIVSFHERFYAPQGLIFAAAGDLDPDLLHRHLRGWLRGRPDSHTRQPVPPTPPAPAPGRRAIPMPHKSQVDLALGGRGIPRYHSDFYALIQANMILGTLGLMGRLGARVRDDLGLAYYVYSRAIARRWAGEWVASAGVHPDHVERAVDAILAEIRRLRDELVSEEEHADAQAHLIGSLPLRLETHDGMADYLLNLEYYGLGLDYLDNYPSLVRSVTREEIQDAVRRHLDPDRLLLALAGPVAS
ncbi:MAG: insulinase family protein [Armatimonadetes bacterium]|nr:insulinase family protein [Armatimonadota bacterium]